MVSCVLASLATLIAGHANRVISQGHDDWVGVVRTSLGTHTLALNKIEAVEALSADISVLSIAVLTVIHTHFTAPVDQEICVVFVVHLSERLLVPYGNDSGHTNISWAFLHAGVSPSVKVFISPTRSTLCGFVSASLTVSRTLSTDTISGSCVIDCVIKGTRVMALLIQVMAKLLHHERPIDCLLFLSYFVVVLFLLCLQTTGAVIN